MRLLNQYIVEFEVVHRTSVEAGGYIMDINPMFDQPKWINRIGKVVETPLSIDTPIQKGYEVLVVHTVLIEEVMPKQGRVINNFVLDQERNWYQFDDNLIVMYRKDKDSDWKCHLDSIMVEPIKIDEQSREVDGITIPDMVFEDSMGYKGNELQKGAIAYGNKNLYKMGLKEGDTIMFKKDREYEFEIDGKTFWHMETNDILMVEEAA